MPSRWFVAVLASLLLERSWGFGHCPKSADFIPAEELQNLRRLSDTLFVHPGRFLVTPIWYRFDPGAPQGSRWFWTPFPEDHVKEESTRWIPVCIDRVPWDVPVKTGKIMSHTFKGQKPVKFNLRIIDYLRVRDPNPEELASYCSAE